MTSGDDTEPSDDNAAPDGGSAAVPTDAGYGGPARLRSDLRDRARTAARSLHYRNFRLYIAGQGLSLIGTWMQRVAMSWLVYRLSGSALLLGIVGFASRIPSLPLSPFAGVLADRWDRRRILYATQGLAMLQALLLATLVLTDVVAIWHVIALAAVLGVLNAFDIPTRHAFFVHMIDDRNDLGNAIALNSSVFNVARLIGPSIAGVMIALIGEGLVFGLNGITYFSMIAALMMMRPATDADAASRERAERPLKNLRDGFRFAFSFRPIRAVLAMLVTVSLLGAPYIVLMPIFATDILGGGPDTLGFLTAAQGVGALAGALYLASRETNDGLGRLIAVAVTIFGAGLFLFSLSRTLWLSMPLLVIVGFGMMVQMAASNTFLQTVVDDGMRGRLMSLYTMSFLGMMPLGSLLAGAVADRIGAPATVMIGAAVSLAAAVVFARRLPALREQTAAHLARRRPAA